MTFKKVLLTIALVECGLMGCSSSEKRIEISANANPQEEISRLDSEIATGYTTQLDLLSASDFTKAQEALSKAKDLQAKNSKQEKVLDEVAIAGGYLKSANDHARPLRDRAGAILDAREGALTAGVDKLTDLQKDMKKDDKNFRSEIGDLEKGNVSPDKWAELQKDYQGLEVKAIQERKLGNSRAQIEGARKNGAEKYAPKTFKQAEIDLKSAENAISEDRHNVQEYQDAVTKANTSAQMLVDVLAAAKSQNGKISEDTAIQLVQAQNNAKSLKSQLEQTQAQANANSEQLNAQVNAQESQLNAASSVVKLDKAIEKAQKEFSGEEADVYRQGDKLLIRLKSVGFAVGRSDLPQQALPLLAKVKTVAEELSPRSIVVEGHTDSTGTAQTNMKLSQERAQAVATYFSANGLNQSKVEAVGYGPEKPVANNKTKTGRAENRRVDVIITPGAVQDQPAQEPDSQKM
jgi:OOP family OmpA-OmpF porin